MKNVTVTTAITEVSANRDRRSILLQNQSASTDIFLKFVDTGDTLTATAGYKLAAGQSITLDGVAGNPMSRTMWIYPIYAIVASGTATLHVQEIL